MSGGFVISLLFGFVYTIPLFFHDYSPNLASAIFVLLYPTLFYLLPQYLEKRFKNPDSIFVVTTILVFCIAIWSIFMNIKDTVTTGEIVNLTRSLATSMSDFQGVATATTHNMMLALAVGGVGMIFVKPQDKVEGFSKAAIVIFGFLALFCALHLLNRTSLFLAVAACMVPFIVKGFTPKSLLIFLLIIAAIVIIFYVFILDSEYYKIVEAGFETRERKSSYDMSSGGGRDVRMMTAILQIPEYPFGTDFLYFGHRNTYAHNTWLDSGIQSGWIALFLLIYITVKFLITGYKTIFKNKDVPRFWRTYLGILSLMMLMQLFVEPVIQGVAVLFFMMFYLWSLFNVLNRRYNYSKVKQYFKSENQIHTPAAS